ncbi:hypothetical protein SAMN03080606_03131 [Alkaliphilus peptidifermentans DSM 18978]|uniref:Uncharacterized protein n=2 Tax=Alkaliphilus TaxID=114627 RepID=A0A1G5JZS6_9FIRM|nr:hypothetical protein SAMN03080606_03131 [Alkaliphilus peptidifermentans DSM 18978]
MLALFLIYSGVRKLVSQDHYSESIIFNLIMSILPLYFFIRERFIIEEMQNYGFASVLTWFMMAVLIAYVYGIYNSVTTKKLSIKGIDEEYIMDSLESVLERYRIEYNKDDKNASKQYVLEDIKATIQIDDSIFTNGKSISFKKITSIPHFEDIIYDLVDLFRKKNDKRPILSGILSISAGFITIIVGLWVYYQYL